MSLEITSLQPQTKGAQAFLARAAQRMLIGGEWVSAASGETLDTLNPATGEVLGKIPAGAEADIDRAVAAARKALTDPSWRELTPSARSRLLWRMAELLEANLDELAELESLDNGKPLWVGKYAEIPGAIEQFRYFAGEARRIEGTTIPTSINYQPPGKKIFAYTVKEPIGVVGAIVPWNSPIVLTAMKIAPALAAGCTMVLKPAEDTSLTAIRLAELMVEAGFPPRRVQRGDGSRRASGRCARRTPRRGQDRLHRINRGGQAHPRCCARQSQKTHARTWWQIAGGSAG